MTVKGKFEEAKHKRDNEGKFARTNSLVHKIAAAKAQGVKHVEPGKHHGYKPKDHASTESRSLGIQIYARKQKGEFKDDHQIFVAAGKMAAQHKKAHPNSKVTANQVVASYKRAEYDHTGEVHLLGEVLGKLDMSKVSKPPSKPNVDKTSTGIQFVSNDKFSAPGALKPTGLTLGGVTGAKVYKDDKGTEWVVKAPKTGSNAYSNSNFLVDLEIAASRIQNKAGLTVPAMHAETVDGKMSAVSKMYKGAADAFGPNGVISDVDIDNMDINALEDIQKQQVLDWLLSNHDSHSGNFLATDEGIVGIDKGQSFKYFGNDKLDWNYVGTTPLSPNVPVYQTLWKQYVAGSSNSMHDPTMGSLHGTIQRLQAIPDADYRKLLRPYAEKAAKDGKLSAPGISSGEGSSTKVEKFLDAAVARKNNLQKDFNALYAKAYKERANVFLAKAEKAQKADHASKATQPSVGNPLKQEGKNVAFDDVAVGDIIVDKHHGIAWKVNEIHTSGGQLTIQNVEQGNIKSAWSYQIDGDQDYVWGKQDAGVDPDLSGQPADWYDIVPGDHLISKAGAHVTVTSIGATTTQGYTPEGNVLVLNKIDFEAGKILHGSKAPVKATRPKIPSPVSTTATPKSSPKHTGPKKFELKPTKMNGQTAPVAATWDNLAIGDKYYTGSKQQQIAAKGENSITVKSVGSGNEYTHTKDKFVKYLADNNAQKGDKPNAASGPASIFADQVEVGDKFKQYNTKYVITAVDPKGNVEWTVDGNPHPPVPYSQFSNHTFGWKFVPPKSDWEEYALGNISWEEYVKASGIDPNANKTKKLHSTEGPAPAPPAITTKESKPPPPWTKITHPAAKTLGQIVYDRKREGKYANDHAMWLDIGKELVKHKKSGADSDGLSQNMIRNAARRLEFDDKGYVAWETAEQKTAQTVEANVAKADTVDHTPIIVRTNSEQVNVPLTAYGDKSSAAGSYLNPHVFPVNGNSDQYKAFGMLMTSQDKKNWPSASISAAEKFTGGGYSEMNAWCRGTSSLYSNVSPETMEKRVKAFDAAFKNKDIVTPLKDWLLVTRGNGAYEVGLPKATATLDELKAQVGKTVKNKAFMSTSITDKSAFAGQVRMVFRLPPGFPGMYVAGNVDGSAISSHSSEREVVLPRGVEYKIISAEPTTMTDQYSFDVVVEVTGGY